MVRNSPNLSLRLLVTNALGIYGKLGELQHIQIPKPNVVVVTETKLTQDKCTDVESSIPSYSQPICQDRTAHGGGVAVWVKADLAYQHLHHVQCCDHEVLWLTATTQSRQKIVLCVVYYLAPVRKRCSPTGVPRWLTRGRPCSRVQDHHFRWLQRPQFRLAQKQQDHKGRRTCRRLVRPARPFSVRRPAHPRTQHPRPGPLGFSVPGAHCSPAPNWPLQSCSSPRGFHSLHIQRA